MATRDTYMNPAHARAVDRVQKLKSKLEAITTELDEMPQDDLPEGENEAIGRVVTLLHEADDILTDVFT